MAIDQELNKLQTRIGNSFLRAFFPIDYRSNQNIMSNIDRLLEREVKGLRTLSSTTSLVSQKISKTLGMMNDELTKMQEYTQSVESKTQAASDILGSASKRAEDTSNALIDFLVAGGLEALMNRRGGGSKTPKTPPETPDRARTKPGPQEKVKSKYKVPKSLGIIGLAITLWSMWSELEALDPNMKKGEYRQAVAQIIGRAVASAGLMWVGAYVGGIVGGALGLGVGAIPGFVVGLVGGFVADYALGDSVDQIVDSVIDYLYTGDEQEENEMPTEEELAAADAAIRSREAPAPTPQLEPVQQQVSDQVGAQIPLAPPIAGPTPPAPPMEQQVDSPVEYPGPVAPVDLAPFAAPTGAAPAANTAVNEAMNKAKNYVPQDTQSQAQFMQNLYNGGDQQTGAAPAGELPPPTGDLLSTAQQYLGMSEGRDRETLNSFIGQYFQPWDVAKTPWCAAFTNSVLASNQLPGTGSGWAKSFLDYGAPVWSRDGGGDINAVQPGDIAVFTRGSGGHVGFVKSFTGDSIVVLGGNQSDSSGGGGAVTESSRGTQNLLKIVRPAAALAEGGRVDPKRGGTLALIAEAGEPEYVVPQSKAIKFAHEMIAARPQTRTKKHTHVVVVPILT